MRAAGRVLYWWAILSAAALAAASAPPQALTDALMLLRNGKPNEAATVLQAAIRQNPGSAQEWRALGAAYRQLKKPQDALAAYQKSLEIEPASPQAFYAMGLLHASNGENDKAFEWLERARASGKIDMSQLTQDVEAKVLRADSRYQR